MRLSPRATGIAAAVVTVIIWTSFIVIARASAQRTLGPFDIAFLRILGASCVLLPWGAWLVRRHGLPGWLGLSPLSFRLTALTGLFGGLLYAMLAYSGFFYAPAVHASVLMPGSLPLWTTLLAALILRDRITPARALGLACIVAGDLLVGGSSLLGAFSGGQVWKGDLLFMSAAFCWAVYSVLARRHGLDAVRATIAVTVFAFIAYVPAYTLLTAWGAMPSRLGAAPAGEVLFQLLFQGGGSVVISGITFTKMVQHFGPVRSTMLTALVPGLSALGAVLFLGEPLYWNLLAGLALVTAGIVFGVRGTLAPTGAAMKKVAAEDRCMRTSG
ncbi:DMT family transporter [Variovorax terrae]|uniref:DMT family transporter n=1 Tax=Variovorax terrae TaxID=2923278 RepID=A0A9X2AQD2_9BURK|nr:DMT family transporter [Variovorax terrae]MCJ0765875.1 DMT family transporter [Variovorax terrae]